VKKRFISSTTKMKNYSFYTLIIFLLSLFLISFLIFPKYQKFNSLKKEILEKERELSSQGEYFETLQKTSEELKKYETSLSKIGAALPKNLSLPELLNFMQKASSQSGLFLKEISPALTAPLEKSAPEGQASPNTVGRGEIKETRINFLLVGSYPDFKNFLFILEKSSRLIDIENVSFSLPKEKEGPSNFAITIKVYSY